MAPKRIQKHPILPPFPTRFELANFVSEECNSKEKYLTMYRKIFLVVQFVTFLGWLSDPCKGISDLQLGDVKVTA